MTGLTASYTPSRTSNVPLRGLVRYSLRMEVNSKRLVGITHFRQHTTSIMDEVADGKTFHLMRDTAVIGHIVPPNALVIDNENLECCLLSNLIDPEADDFARSVIKEGYLAHVGDSVGRVFAWLWNTDTNKAMRWVTYYAQRVANALRDQRYSRPTYDQLWFAVSRGLSVSMRAADIEDFDQLFRTEISLRDPALFSPAELAGEPRPQEPDDPWPDAVANDRGRGFTKRRWRHLEAGQYIPDPTLGYTLPEDDHWCRIESITGADAVLQQSDATPIPFTIDNPDTWLPVVGHTPFYWGTSHLVLRAP